ncbi:hypothetical protein BDF22DRAFT_657128 [Syncephalis plumigaleata]|nr:hypothetical protein BDF22DRAFT_657128 [Syncephalis plumigaleata]
MQPRTDIILKQLICLIALLDAVSAAPLPQVGLISTAHPQQYDMNQMHPMNNQYGMNNQYNMNNQQQFVNNNNNNGVVSNLVSKIPYIGNRLQRSNTYPPANTNNRDYMGNHSGGMDPMAALMINTSRSEANTNNMMVGAMTAQTAATSAANGAQQLSAANTQASNKLAMENTNSVTALTTANNQLNSQVIALAKQDTQSTVMLTNAATQAEISRMQQENRLKLSEKAADITQQTNSNTPVNGQNPSADTTQGPTTGNTDNTSVNKNINSNNGAVNNVVNNPQLNNLNGDGTPGNMPTTTTPRP